MTDEQIVKAFKICNSENLGCEDDCPFNEICKKDNGKLYRAIIDLIERQQAEIRRNRAEISRLHNILLAFMDEVAMWGNKKGYDTSGIPLIPILNEANGITDKVKAEAIKEFAVRLKKRLDRKHTIYGREYVLRHLRELVKEMTEEEK